jgi:glycosyltransferase involved in cell wall biosynthesis
VRILMLAQFYAPIVGGEEQLVRSLSLELAARGHQVAVATLWHAGLPVFEHDRGVRVYRIRGAMQQVSGIFSESGRRHAPPFPDPALTRQLAGILARERPQIVHGHNWLERSFLPLKRRHGPRLIVSLHDYCRSCAKKNLLYQGAPCSGPALAKCVGCASSHYGIKGVPVTVGNWATAQLEQRLVDLYLPVSQAVAIGNGLTRGDVPYEVIPNFLPDVSDDTNDVDDMTSRLPSSPFIMYAGDLSWIKGIEILVRAYAAMPRETVPPVVMVGRMTPETPSSIPPNMFAMGRWPHAAVMHAWRRSLFGVVPSIWHEPFGIVLLEAMSAGRAVVASRTGAISDIVVDGETGLLVPPGDAVALSLAMRRLIEDDALRKRLGAAARHRLEQFSARQVVPRFERAYQSVLGSTDK